MKKVLAYLWLPIVSSVILVIIYGSLAILDLKNQNQNLNQKQKQLEKQIVLLENKFEALTTSLSQVQTKVPKKIAGVTAESISEATTQNDLPSTSGNQNQPTPQPSLAITPSITTSPVQTSTSRSSPTPKPTPTPEPKPIAKATVLIEQVGEYQVNLTDDDTAFTILLRAGKENGFTVEYQMYDLGVFITCIAGICPTGNQYWAFYYNGAYSMVGASAQEVKDGDTTAWKLESF